MARQTLTDRKIKSLKPRGGAPYIKPDPQVPGHGVRVMPSGKLTFVLSARYPGSAHPAPRALGGYGELTLEQARAKAQVWRNLISRGVDPGVAEERERQAELRKQRATFAAVAEDFIRDKLSIERKGKEVERDIRREFIPAWGKRPIAEIEAQDVLVVIRAARDRGASYQAHNLLGTAKRLWTWAIDQQAYGLETSPCDRLKPKAIIGERKARQRILADDEIRALWRAAERHRYPYGPAAQLMLLTGQRHREVSNARRSEFHPEFMALIRRSDGKMPINWQAVPAEWKLWCVGEERFKSDAPHMVPLADDACAIIADLPEFRTGDYLFSTTFGRKPTSISDKEKNKIDSAMLCTLKAMARLRGDDPDRVELRPWVIHDLRRVLRTHLSALRIPDHVAEMVIGHGRKGLQRVYDQHRYIEEMRDALAQWAARLRSIVEPPPANVVQFGGKQLIPASA